MNKIYKVIWSKVKHQYVVVSELAHSNGKQSRTSRNSIRSRIAALVVCGAIAAFGVFSALPMDSAYAADVNVQQATQTQYVAFRADTTSDEWRKGEKTIEGIVFRPQTIRLSDKTLNYWVREGYTLKATEGIQYIPDNLMKTDDVNGLKSDYAISAEITDQNLIKGSVLKTTESSAVGTTAMTTRNESLQKIEVGHYTGVSNSGGVGTGTIDWNYIIDPNGQGNVNEFIDIKDAAPDQWDPSQGKYVKDVWKSGYLKEVELRGSSYYLKDTNQEVASQNVYIIGDKAGAFVTTKNGSEIYTGRVYGAHNEILMTGKDENGNYYTYWAGKVNDDDNVLLSDSNLTLGDYKENVNAFYRNDRKLAAADIKSVEVDANNNGINLITNTQFDENGKPIERTEETITGFTVTSVKNTGEDTKIQFSDGENNKFDVDAGSRVVATKDEDGKVSELSINGTKYAIGGGETYTAGDGIAIATDDNNKISVNAGDGLTFETQEGEDKGKLKVNVGDGLSITNGEVVNNFKVEADKNAADGSDDNWTITDGQQKFTNTTLVNGTVEKRAIQDNAYGSDYLVKDTDGNTATLYDVASATKLKEVAGNSANINLSNITTDGQTEIKNLAKDVEKHIATSEEAAYPSGGYKVDKTAHTVTLVEANGNGVATGKNVVISDVASAEDLGNLTTKVNNGWNVSDGNDGNADFAVKPGETLTFNGDDNIDVEAKDHEVNVSLNDNITLGEGNSQININGAPEGDEPALSIGDKFVVEQNGSVSIKADNAETYGIDTTVTINPDGVKFEKYGNGTTVINGQTIQAGGVAINGEDNYKGTITGLTNTTLGDGSESSTFAKAGRAATEEQLQAAMTKIDEASYKGWNVSANGENSTTVESGKIVDFSGAKDTNGDSNITVTKTVDEKGNAELAFDLNDNITLGEEGDNQININGAPEDGEAALSIGDKFVVEQNGSVSIKADNTETYGTDTTVTVNPDGVKFEKYGNGTTVINGQTIQAGGVVINGEDNGVYKGTITGLTNTTLDDETFATVGRAATEEQLKQAAAASKTTISDGKNTTVTSTEEADGHIDYKVNLNDNVTLGTGDNQININGAPEGDEPALSIGDKFVVEQNGSVSIKADNTETYGTDTTVTVNPDGVKFEKYGNGTTVINGQTIQAGGVVINGEDNGVYKGTITGLTNTTLDDETFATVGRAATEEQLKQAAAASKTTISDGKNTTVTSTEEADGHIDYKVNLNDNVTLGTGDNQININGAPEGDEPALSIGDKFVVEQNGSVSIKADNTETYGTDTTVTVNPDGVKFEKYGNGTTVINGQTIQAGGVVINGEDNGVYKGTITGLTNTTLDDETFATVGRAATEEQLKQAAAASKTTISDGKNTTVTSTEEADGHIDYKVNLNDNVTLGTGDNQININGAPEGDEPALSIGDKFVVEQNGSVSIKADNTETYGTDTTVTVNPDGVKFEKYGNGTTVINGQTIQAGGVVINGEDNGVYKGTITGLTNTTLDDETFATVGRAATEEQLKQAAAASKTTLSDGVNTTVTSNDNTPDGHVDYQVNLNDNVYLGGNNKPGSSNIELDGENGTIQVGSNIILDSKEARAVIGGVDISTTFDDIGKKSSTITGLSNTTWDTDKVVIDRAATEGQLQMVSDKVTAGWTATDDAGHKINVNPNTRPTLNFASGKNITVSANEDNGEVEVSLNDVVTLGDGEDAIKIDGTNGTLNIGSTFAVAEDGTVLSDGDVIADADGEKYSLSEVGKYAVRYDKTNDGTSTITLADGDDLSGTRIKNVADGVDPKDAVNVSQLEAVEATANAGWTASDGTNSISIKPNETLNFVGDENLTVSADGTDKKLKVSLNDDITLGNTEAGNTEGERSFTINTTDPNGYVPESYKTGSGANFIEENGGFMLFATDTQGHGIFGVTTKGTAHGKDFVTYTKDIYGNDTRYSLNDVGDAVAQMSSYYNEENRKSYTVFSRYLNEAEKDNPFVTVDEDGNKINATRDIPLALRDDGAVLIGATIKGEDFTDNGIRINAETETTYDEDGNEVTNNIATITGLENTEWTPPAPVATFANEGTETSRAATEAQLNDLYGTVVGYNVDTDGVNYGTVTLGGGRTSYDKDTHEGGTVLNNVAYASGTDGSEAVNVDYLNDAINNAVKDGGAISDSDRHLQEGTYHVNDQGEVELIVADEKGENRSTVTIDNIANKNDITNLDNKIDNTFNDLNDKINNIDNVETDVKGGNINEDGTISLKTENEDGTTTNVTLKGQLTDSGVVQEGTTFDKETGTLTITSQDKYSGKTSSVTVDGIASTDVVGVTTKEELADKYKAADEDGNATTAYITESESMVEADVALDHAIQDVAGTSYANDMVLSNRIDSVEKRLGNVEERIDKVGAMAAAIANLRTMGFDPEAPTEIAIGVGQYKSETGIAIGVFHYPNQDFMLSASLSSSGDELMGGIGATWKLGRKSAAERAKDEEARHLEQAEEMKKLAQQEKVKAQAQRHAKLLAERQQASQKNA